MSNLMTDTTDIKALREKFETLSQIGDFYYFAKYLLDQLEAERQRAVKLDDRAKCAEAERDKNIAWHSKQWKRPNELEAELAALEGDQVPVGFIHHLDVAELKAGGDAEIKPHKTADWQIPVFTAPQKPVVLPNYEDCPSCDRHYVAGMKDGWNFHEDGDNQGFIDSIERVQKDMREARKDRVKNDV